MFNNKSSKRALVMSVLSLVLCVSMFVGTTFAWFTDSVTSTNNIIKSGSLDVQMLWSDTVDGTYKDAENAAYPIFNYQYWEPGYTEIKYIKIKNAGDLAFQFQLNIIPDNLPAEGEDNLADVIDVYLLPAAAVTRADVDAATPVGTLSSLIADRDGAAHGILLPTDGSDRYNDVDAPVGEIAYCIALKMRESAGNEYQNLSVGDGFSLQLLATQYTWEKDSFDHNYDEDAMFPPKADVKCTGPKMIPLKGVGNVVANDTLQFLPKNNYEEAQKNSYRFWHADFVVYADEVIPANSVTLAGFYTAFCGVNGDWIGMSSDQDIPANTPIRLVDLLGVTVNFEEICKWSDGEGFQCGVIDNSNGALAGTTLTVELRLYETTKDPDATSGTANEEVRPENYIVVEDYKYTFGKEVLANDMDSIQDAIDNGATVIDAMGADLGDFYYDIKFTDGVTLKNAKFTYFYGGNVTGTVTFENCEFVSAHSYSANFDSGNGNIIFNNCLFDGWNSFGSAITGVEMNNCTFRKTYNYGILRFYQDAVLNNCVFEDTFEGIDSNVTGTTVNFNNCTGIEGKIFNNGSVVGNWFVDGVDVSSTVTSW